jgi:hypothetical protein
MYLSRVLTNANRSSVGTELDKLLTNGQENNLLSIASLLSSGTALRLNNLITVIALSSFYLHTNQEVYSRPN